MEVDDEPYDAAVQAVVARFEARLSGGEQKWACSPLLELAFPPIHAVDPPRPLPVPPAHCPREVAALVD